MINRIVLLSSLSIIISASAAQAQPSTGANANGQINTITTAVPFLRISPDARSGAMGDVGVAISADANAQYWNLAKLPFAEKKYGVSATYTPWLKDLVPDISLIYVSGFAKFGEGDNQTISSSLRYFSLGNINYTDINAQPAGTGMPREFAFDLGYSRKLSEYFSAGVGLRYINSSLATGFSDPNQVIKPGNAVAADLGLFYSKRTVLQDGKARTLNLGAALTNVGSKISYNSLRKDFIPSNLGIGLAYTTEIDEFNKITAAIDFNKLLVPSPLFDSLGRQYYPDKGVVSGLFGSFGDAPGGFNEELKEIQISTGLEYWYQNQFAVRAGYFYEDKLKGARKYFTLGLGLRYNVFNVNLAYLVASGSGINRNPLSNTLRFSLVFDFDKLAKSDNTTTN